MITVLNEFKTTTEILLQALRMHDLDKGHEAVSVLLMQGINMIGKDHPAMQQFFPVWSSIEKHISEGNVDRALGQTETWMNQLDDVIEIVRDGSQ